MPNGESKTWIRFQITLESFYTLYNCWPTSISLYQFFIDELHNKLSSDDREKLHAKITLIPDDDNPFVASDDTGNKYDYARGQEVPEKRLPQRAVDWLDISRPHYYDYN